jgi:hypothetical protein
MMIPKFGQSVTSPLKPGKNPTFRAGGKHPSESSIYMPSQGHRCPGPVFYTGNGKNAGSSTKTPTGNGIFAVFSCKLNFDFGSFPGSLSRGKNFLGK